MIGSTPLDAVDGTAVSCRKPGGWSNKPCSDSQLPISTGQPWIYEQIQHCAVATMGEVIPHKASHWVNLPNSCSTSLMLCTGKACLPLLTFSKVCPTRSWHNDVPVRHLRHSGYSPILTRITQGKMLVRTWGHTERCTVRQRCSRSI